MEAGAWLLAALLLTGVRGQKDSLFVYSRLGGDALLPCAAPDSSACAAISWTFYKGGVVRYTEEVSRGRVRAGSDRAERLLLTADCSLRLRGLRVEDAGSYVCLRDEEAVRDVYLSLLTVTSRSGITELRPGGGLALSCVLYTYYDAGSCTSYTSSLFQLSWRSVDGSALNGSRYRLVGASRCNVTLVTTLQADDRGRGWRCQVNTANSSAAEFIDLRPAFLFGDTEEQRRPPVAVECSASPPICRVVLCVALPLMVVAVGLLTWKLDRNQRRRDATPA